MHDNKYELERQNHKDPINITIFTKVPSKWRFVDLETKDIWEWDEKESIFKRAKII